MKGLRALARVKDFMSQNCKHWKQDIGYIEQELKALDILTKSLALEMSVDEDYAVLFVKISKDKLCVVGNVKGKENIDPLKVVMKYYEEAPQFTDLDREKLTKELLKGEVFRVNEKNLNQH